MIKKIFLLFILLSNILLSQEKTENYYYSGVIGDKYKIRMNLEINKTGVRGEYFYLSSGESIYISGSLNNGKLDLKEEVNEKVTGILTGTINTDNSRISGEWSKPDGSKKLSLKCELEATGKNITSDEFIINVKFPFLLKDVIKFKNQLNDSISSLMKKEYNNYLADATENYKDASDDEMKKEVKERYAWETSVSFAHLSNNIASLEVNVYQNSGGVHPNSWIYSVNYDTRSAKFKRIELKNLFKSNSGYENILSDLLISELKKKKASSIVNEEITDFTEDIIKDNLHYVILPKGLRFDFSPYAVASYAEGAFHVQITYDRLKEVIDFNGILSEFKSK